MEMLEGFLVATYILVLLFPILIISFFVWLFFNIRAVVAKKKLNRPVISKEIKKEIRRRPFPKISFISSLSIISFYITYIMIGILLLGYGILWIFDAIILQLDGNSSSITFENFGDFLLCYWCMFIFVGILFYIALFVLIARGIYINIIYRNKLITLEPGEPTLSTPLDSRIRKKRLLITCGIIVAGILYTLVSTPIGKWIITYNSVELSEIAYTPNEITTSWYYFYENRILVYTDDSDETLISTNLKGRNKKVISSSEELFGANIYMVYNNEAYYYSVRNNSLNKINLHTGEITTITSGKHIYIIPDTLNEGTVLVNYKVNSTPFFATLNLDNGTLYNVKKANFSYTKAHFYDVTAQNLYYISGTDLIENGNSIYKFTRTSCQNVAFVQGNYIVGISGNTMVILNKNTYEVVKEQTINMDFSLIPSVRRGGSTIITGNDKYLGGDPILTATHPVFTVEAQNGIDDIYIFNNETFSFEKLINTNTHNSFVQKYDDNYIVQTPKETIIYNISDKEVKTYNSLNYTVEDGYIYLFSYKNNNQEIYKPEYKILKEKL